MPSGVCHGVCGLAHRCAHTYARDLRNLSVTDAHPAVHGGQEDSQHQKKMLSVA